MSSLTQSLLALILLLSLFLSDSWILANVNSNQDHILYLILFIIFIIFSLETIILSLVQEDYIFSFFFWMDTLGTLSIILDINWIAHHFMSDDTATSRGSILRAARAAKLGARYGRLMRLMKFMRLMKLNHFFKFLPCIDEKPEVEPEPTLSAVRKVSAALSLVLSRRVAALVMVIVIIVPFLSYDQVDYSPNAWAKSFRIAAQNSNTTLHEIQYMSQEFRDFYNSKAISALSLLIESKYLPTQNFHYSMPYYVRNDNIYHVDSDYFLEKDKYKIRIQMNITPVAQWNAFFGIILIILVIVVLVGFSASFQGAVDELVVLPLEKMMITLRNSAASLLRGMKALHKEDEAKEDGEQTDSESDLDEELETAVLEKMVEKLARIVKHVTNENELVVDVGVDSATASWLNQNYTGGNEIRRIPSRKTSSINLVLSQHNVEVPLLNSWNYDVLKYSYDELNDAILYMLGTFNSISEFRIPLGILNKFLREISRVYVKSNQYHNFHHGVDVMHTTYRLLVVSKLNDCFSQLELFSMLIAALSHDLGHPGVNNAFLVKTKDDLAMFHNDKSPLENMHCSSLYRLLNKSEFNFMANLTEPQWRESRKIVLFMILGTDMAQHFEQVSKTQFFLEVNGEDTKRYCSGLQSHIECFSEEKNRLFIMEIFLHCADISNPYKPFQICAKWADLVSQEFFSQGDKEKELGLDISPMMDRSNSNLNNMQIGFIEFVVSPLISTVVNVFPPLKEIGDTLLANYISWGKLRIDEILVTMEGSPEKKEEEIIKIEERIQKFKDRMGFLSHI